jgi:hypothetical protein
LKNIGNQFCVKNRSQTSKIRHRYTLLSLLVLPILACPSIFGSITPTQNDDYLSWDINRCREIIKTMWGKGKVGAGQGLIHTERAHSYKLRATWLTPEVMRASARMLQIGNRLTDEATRALITEAEAIGDTVMIVDIDPREGSGVIPNDWQVFLQSKSEKKVPGNPVSGVSTNKLRDVKVIASAVMRDYDYDRFYVIFPLKNEKGESVLPDSAQEAELVVRIYDKEGKVTWKIADSIRTRIHTLSKRDQR